MSIPQNQLFETALSLPQSERADLALQLLQSLHPPGEEVGPDEFGAELRDRIAGYHRGDIGSSTLEETRAIVQQRLSEGHTP